MKLKDCPDAKTLLCGWPKGKLFKMECGVMGYLLENTDKPGVFGWVSDSERFLKALGEVFDQRNKTVQKSNSKGAVIFKKILEDKKAINAPHTKRR